MIPAHIKVALEAGFQFFKQAVVIESVLQKWQLVMFLFIPN
jgi:hypothetical protein